MEKSGKMLEKKIQWWPGPVRVVCPAAAVRFTLHTRLQRPHCHGAKWPEAQSESALSQYYRGCFMLVMVI